jgi:polar amino acid transport system substrate-binding protein
MPNTLFWALRWGLALALCVPAAHAREWSEVKQQGKVIVATEGQFEPFNHIRETKVVGFEVDLMELIAKKMGLAVEWKTADFDTLLPGLQQNRWDLVIASHAITDERAKAVAFTDSHYCSGAVVVTKNLLLRHPSDLKGKSVAVQAGTSYLENAQKIPGIKEVKSFPQDAEARNAMLADRVDFWLTDRFVAASTLRGAPASGARSVQLLFPERIAAAVAKGNEPARAEYNKALAAVMGDGSYDRLSRQYFADLDLRCPATAAKAGNPAAKTP